MVRAGVVLLHRVGPSSVPQKCWGLRMNPPDFTGKADAFCALDERLPGWVRQQVRADLEAAWRAGFRAGVDDARVRVERAFSADEPTAEPHD